MSRSRPLLYSLLTVLLLPGPIASQPVGRPPLTGAQVMQALREGRGVGHARRALQQLDGPVSRAVQDELADSMVAFVRGMSGSMARSEANNVVTKSIVYAIGISGLRDQAAGSKPYAGAGERLFQLALIIDRSLVASTVYLMSEVADRSEALALLRRFATTSNPVAYQSIMHLAQMEAVGMRSLRSLRDQNLVTEPNAKRILHAIASEQEWVKRL